jgi:hypothetical protein
MPLYIISYDLRKQRNYSDLIDAIKSLGPWAHVLESIWAVKTGLSFTEIRDFLNNYLDSDDRLIVFKSGSSAAWKNVLCNNQWLIDNLK